MTVVDPAVAEPTVQVVVVQYVDQNGSPVGIATELVAIVPQTVQHVAPALDALSLSIASTQSPQSSPETTPLVIQPTVDVQLSVSLITAASIASSSDDAVVEAPVVVDKVAVSILPSSLEPLQPILKVILPFPSSAPSASLVSIPSIPSQLVLLPDQIAQGSSWDESSSLFGVCYSPYNSDGTCKTQAQVSEDVNKFAGRYSMVRLYGTDCNQLSLVLGAAKSAGLRILVGIFELDSLDQEVHTIVAAIGAEWGAVAGVTVGNEQVNNGQASAAQVVSAVKQTRQLLRAAGYNGPVASVDTFVAVKQWPELCDSSDFCAINVHPFFDGNTAAADAGAFVSKSVAQVRDRLANQAQTIVVTETGWPWRGNKNGLAVPGASQQSAALSSIQSAFATSPANLILFSGYNDLWKKAQADTFYAEQYWGVGGEDSLG